ncbi:hypothetical protein QR680_013921 [Steinernema hermaphroditum]|uniref:Uncharacterized protein n=1 Tax=Steinernema hermaphroditum TaxID=289476 RepID=A0AA39I753_9BILA|nr:hypothetical protein QR680_013921 [Steinernema hermaphroditum]
MVTFDDTFFIGVSYALNSLIGFFFTGFVLAVILLSELRANRTFRIIALLCVSDLVQLFCLAIASVIVMVGDIPLEKRPFIDKFVGALILGSWMAMVFLELALAINRLAVITDTTFLLKVEMICLPISFFVGVYFTICLLIFDTHSHMDFQILTFKSYRSTRLSRLNFSMQLWFSVVPMILNIVAYAIIGIYIFAKKLQTRWNEIRFLVAVIGGFVYTLFLACFYHYWYDIFNDNRTIWIIQHHAWTFLFTFACCLHLHFNSELRKNAVGLLKKAKKIISRSNSVQTIYVQKFESALSREAAARNSVYPF